MLKSSVAPGCLFKGLALVVPLPMPTFLREEKETLAVAEETFVCLCKRHSSLLLLVYLGNDKISMLIMLSFTWMPANSFTLTISLGSWGMFLKTAI